MLMQNNKKKLMLNKSLNTLKMNQMNQKKLHSGELKISNKQNQYINIINTNKMKELNNKINHKNFNQV